MSQFSKTTLFYKILRVYTNFVYSRWFSRCEINGVGNIPEGEPVIFAPNHQNAFVDAMALLFSSPQPVVFWVRADLFQNRLIDKFLRALKMMPAYRMRNGVSNLKKNEESLRDSVDVLTHDQFLCLMPEGGQEEKRQLRPLVKGIFRTAFAAQEQLSDTWVKIVPVGIDYGHYDRSGRHLILSFGRPLNIKDYYAQYQQDAPHAMNAIRKDLSEKIAPLMLDIQSEKYYETFYTAAYLYNEQMLDRLGLEDNQTNRLIARQKIVSLLGEVEAAGDETLESLSMACEAWRGKSDDVAFRAVTSEVSGVDADLVTKILYLLVTIPLFLYGVIVNFFPFMISKLLGARAHGSGFESSLKLGSAMLFTPIFYVIETILFPTLFPVLMQALYGIPYEADTMTVVAFFFTLPISYFFMLRYRWKFQYVKERLRGFFDKASVMTRENAVSLIHNLVSKYMPHK